MDIFTVSYIFLVTLCIAAIIGFIQIAYKQKRIELSSIMKSRDDYDPDRIRELKGDTWIVIRYVDTDENGEECIKEEEISYKAFMTNISKLMDTRLK